MTKFLPALLAAATLGLGSAAMAESNTKAPAPLAPGATQSKSGATAPSGSAEKGLSETQVRQQLQKQGYDNVGEVKRKGDRFEAQAVKDGKRVSVDVDAKTGQAVTR